MWGGYVHLSTGVCRVRERMSYSLLMEAEQLWTYLMWVLGPKLRSPARAVRALTCRAISPSL